MTANVAGQEWMGFEKRKAAAAEVFKRTRADLVGFQELGISNWESVFKNARPDLEIIHGRVAGDIIINSIAYNPERFSHLASDSFWLSPDGSATPGWDGSLRGVTWGWFLDKEVNKELIFVNTHFDHKGIEARIESVRQLTSWAKHHADMSFILTADANVSVASPNPRWLEQDMRRPYELMLSAGFVDTWTARHPTKPRPGTFHNFLGKEYDPIRDDAYGTYDTEWIMAKGSFVVRDVRLITDDVGGQYPSDHFWVEAELDWI
jgi:endonuclease/exonuclease/phosphatase family metal-dependent hydrolase